VELIDGSNCYQMPSVDVGYIGLQGCDQGELDDGRVGAKPHAFYTALLFMFACLVL
jgi:hypothetical protein